MFTVVARWSKAVVVRAQCNTPPPPNVGSGKCTAAVTEWVGIPFALREVWQGCPFIPLISASKDRLCHVLVIWP